MPVDERERVILYWVSGHSQATLPLGPNGGEGLYRPWLLRDCCVAGMEVPTPDECLAYLQRLAEEGYVTAFMYDDRGNEKQIAQFADRSDADEIVFRLTESGGGEAYAFVESLQRGDARSRSANCSREHVREATRHLPFEVRIPSYVPPTFDDFAVVVTYPENEDAVTLRYYQWGDDQLFIDQTVAELGEEEEQDGAFEESDRISGVPVVIFERLLGPQWAEVSLEWRDGGVSFRVSYHRTEGGSLEEDQDTESEGADYHVEDYQDAEAEEQVVLVDDVMRSEARRVAESLIAG